jgi:hypothetical protein
MGVHTVREMFCDLCKSTTGVRRWTIATADKKINARGELCYDCERAIVDTAKKLPAVKPGRQPSRPVLTEAQVKARKKKA